MLGCPMSIVKFSYQIPNEPRSGVQTIAQGVSPGSAYTVMPSPERAEEGCSAALSGLIFRWIRNPGLTPRARLLTPLRGSF